MSATLNKLWNCDGPVLILQPVISEKDKDKEVFKTLRTINYKYAKTFSYSYWTVSSDNLPPKWMLPAVVPQIPDKYSVLLWLGKHTCVDYFNWRPLDKLLSPFLSVSGNPVGENTFLIYSPDAPVFGGTFSLNAFIAYPQTKFGKQFFKQWFSEGDWTINERNEWIAKVSAEYVAEKLLERKEFAENSSRVSYQAFANYDYFTAGSTQACIFDFQGFQDAATHYVNTYQSKVPLKSVRNKDQQYEKDLLFAARDKYEKNPRAFRGGEARIKLINDRLNTCFKYSDYAVKYNLVIYFGKRPPDPKIYPPSSSSSSASSTCQIYPPTPAPSPTNTPQTNRPTPIYAPNNGPSSSGQAAAPAAATLDTKYQLPPNASRTDRPPVTAIATAATYSPNNTAAAAAAATPGMMSSSVRLPIPGSTAVVFSGHIATAAAAAAPDYKSTSSKSGTSAANPVDSGSGRTAVVSGSDAWRLVVLPQIVDERIIRKPEPVRQGQSRASTRTTSMQLATRTTLMELDEPMQPASGFGSLGLNLTVGPHSTPAATSASAAASAAMQVDLAVGTYGSSSSSGSSSGSLRGLAVGLQTADKKTGLESATTLMEDEDDPDVQILSVKVRASEQGRGRGDGDEKWMAVIVFCDTDMAENPPPRPPTQPNVWNAWREESKDAWGRIRFMIMTEVLTILSKQLKTPGEIQFTVVLEKMIDYISQLWPNTAVVYFVYLDTVPIRSAEELLQLPIETHVCDWRTGFGESMIFTDDRISVVTEYGQSIASMRRKSIIVPPKCLIAEYRAQKNDKTPIIWDSFYEKKHRVYDVRTNTVHDLAMREAIALSYLRGYFFFRKVSPHIRDLTTWPNTTQIALAAQSISLPPSLIQPAAQSMPPSSSSSSSSLSNNRSGGHVRHVRFRPMIFSRKTGSIQKTG